MSRSIRLLIDWDQFRSIRVFRSGYLLVGNNLLISVVIPKSTLRDPTSEGDLPVYLLCAPSAMTCGRAWCETPSDLERTDGIRTRTT